jgi:hypothetical protein
MNFYFFKQYATDVVFYPMYSTQRNTTISFSSDTRYFWIRQHAINNGSFFKQRTDMNNDVEERKSYDKSKNERRAFL